jgi:hypothetical protein
VTDRPVFVAGLDRTGKTPMRIAIESRASIAMSRRANLWTHHRGRYGALDDDARARLAVAGLLRDRHVAALVHDADALLSAILAGPRTYAHLYALVGRQHAERAGRERWGHQEALLERHAPEILEAYPAARIVHMIRDPRDRYAAALRDGAVGRAGPGGAADRWRESVSLAGRHAAAWPDRYLVVRYEDLALEPVATVGRVMAFIGEPAGPSAAQAAPIPAGLAHGVGLHGRLPSRTIALIQERCAVPMARHGYELVAADLTATDRVGMALVDRPRAAATAAFQRLRGGADGPRTHGRMETGR